EKMLAQVNQVEYGLTCSIWTNDLVTAHRVAGAVEAGVGWVNEGSKQFLRAPLGGLQPTGRGSRGRNREAPDLPPREEHPRQPQAAQRRALMLPDHARVGCPARGIATISRKNRSCLWEESTDGAQPSAHDRVVAVRKRDHCSAQNTSAATLSVQSELLCSPEGLMRLIPQFNVNGQFTIPNPNTDLQTFLSAQQGLSNAIDMILAQENISQNPSNIGSLPSRPLIFASNWLSSEVGIQTD